MILDKAAGGQRLTPYDVARVNDRLGITPAIASGIADYVWLLTTLNAGAMNDFKLLVRGSAKVTGGIAALVFLRAPFTETGLALTAASIVVGLACLGAYTWAEPDDDDPENPK